MSFWGTVVITSSMNWVNPEMRWRNLGSFKGCKFQHSAQADSPLSLPRLSDARAESSLADVSSGTDSLENSNKDDAAETASEITPVEVDTTIESESEEAGPIVPEEENDKYVQLHILSLA